MLKGSLDDATIDQKQFFLLLLPCLAVYRTFVLLLPGLAVGGITHVKDYSSHETSPLSQTFPLLIAARMPFY